MCCYRQTFFLYIFIHYWSISIYLGQDSLGFCFACCSILYFYICSDLIMFYLLATQEKRQKSIPVCNSPPNPSMNKHKIPPFQTKFDLTWLLVLMFYNNYPLRKWRHTVYIEEIRWAKNGSNINREQISLRQFRPTVQCMCNLFWLHWWSVEINMLIVFILSSIYYTKIYLLTRAFTDVCSLVSQMLSGWDNCKSNFDHARTRSKRCDYHIQ